MKTEMMCLTTYKQYKVREGGSEPRLHALYCSSKGGYQYGRVKMASHPLESLPVISRVAKRLASKFGLLNDHWNIRYHLLLYRDGKDSIHWHADDIQGEDVVSCHCKGNWNWDDGIHSLQYASESCLGEKMSHAGCKMESDLDNKYHSDCPPHLQM